MKILRQRVKCPPCCCHNRPPSYIFRPPAANLAASAESSSNTKRQFFNPSITPQAVHPEEQGGRQPPHIVSSMRSKGVPNAFRYIANDYRLRRASDAPHHRGPCR